MKLRQVTDHHLNSGIGRYSFELSKALIKQGHEVKLSKLYKKKGDDDLFDQSYDWIDKIHYKSFRQLHSYLLPYFIGAHAFPRTADIFHAHWFMAGLGMIKAGKNRTVITMHDVSLLHEQERAGKFLDYYRRAIDLFAAKRLPIIVVSESARQDALKYSNLREEQLFTVHNGINFDQFYPQERKSNDRPQLVYAGGLSPRKNIELLLEACALLESRNVDFQLKIAGNHPERTPYREMAAALKLRNVEFSGFIADDQMNDFYNHADLFVYPSKYEGFGFAPLEAMACGTPVLSAKGGSLEEVSGGGAHLFDYDKEALAEAIISHLNDQKRRNQLAAKGSEWVQRYTWEACASQTMKVYETLRS